MRGIITDEIKDISMNHLGYYINQDELRLMTYIDYFL